MFPQKIFVEIEGDEREASDVENLMAWRDMGSAEDGKLAVYELKKIGTKKTKTVFEDK